jgi:hypothetical protein
MSPKTDTEVRQERHRDRQGGQGIHGRGMSRDERARPRAEGGSAPWPRGSMRHQSQRASPLVENLIRDARVRGGRQFISIAVREA